jgi:mannose-6-phosphate isomerase class I
MNLESEMETKKKRNSNSEGLVKLTPVLKDYIWGGTKIRDVLKKDTKNFETVAESWELSAHQAGQSKIANGRYKDYTFSEYISVVGKEKLGWKTQSYDRFPLMIKFIDAREALSVQVHPNDDYALPKEKDYGKNEMWHIVGADKDAYIYVGFKKDVTREEVKERIKKNTLVEVLNKIPVKSGETYFLRAGTVHAIGAGCLICEVQQSSNVTYRLYDYGRKGKDGKPRELHVAKALDVLDYNKTLEEYRVSNAEIDFEGYVEKLIGECKYFSVKRYDINGTLKLPPGDSTFQVVVVIDGKGKISNGDYVYDTVIGETWFCGSNDVVELEGKCSALIVSI